MRFLCVILAGIGLSLLAGCSNAFVDNDQPAVAPEALVHLTPDQTIGQSFVARYAGLNGVEVWLEPGVGKQGELRLHLRSEPGATDDLVTADLPGERVTAPGFYHFSFSPLNDSSGRYFYISIEKYEAGSLMVGASSDISAYLNGTLYVGEQPYPAQMAFRLTYARGQMLLDLGRVLCQDLGLLALAGLIFITPGWALLAWLQKDTLRPSPITLSVAIGVSLAFYPVLFLWTDLIGVHLGAFYVWLPTLGGLVALAWRHRYFRLRVKWETLRAWGASATIWPDIVLLLVVAFSFWVRLQAVHNLEVAMWADSYQHTLMTQLLLDNNGLFRSWEPYTPYQSLTVHFGFPTLAALLSWITGMESTQATLLAGQLVNGLAIVTLYPLAVRISGGNRWAGVGAVLIAGLLSPMPMEYVNWGRFPQATGQAILPIALWLMWEALDQKRLSLRFVLLAGLCLAGMALTYYRMIFFYITFVFAWGLGWSLPHWKSGLRQWRIMAIRLMVIIGFALLIFLPWQRFITGGALVESLGEGIAKGTRFEIVKEDYRAWLDILNYVPAPLLVLSLAALVWSLLRRWWEVAAIGLWVLGLASLVGLRLLHVPATNQMQNFAVLIALYIPVGLLGGWSLGEIAILLQRRISAYAQWITAATVIILSLFGIIELIKVVHPNYYVMVTRPDMRAMTWIRQNTAADARFLVEGFRIYGGVTAVGADAGWWIPLLAGRQNTMPPQYALANETPNEIGYSQRIVDLLAHLETNSPTSPDSIKLLCDSRIGYVYIGQRQGNVGSQARQLFTAEVFENSAAFERVYQSDLVSIFFLRPQACRGT